MRRVIGEERLQGGPVRRFAEVSLKARLGSLSPIRFIAETGESDQMRGRGHFAAQSASQAEAVEGRHGDVENGHVWGGLLDYVQTRQAIVRAACNFKAGPLQKA